MIHEVSLKKMGRPGISCRRAIFWSVRQISWSVRQDSTVILDLTTDGCQTTEVFVFSRFLPFLPNKNRHGPLRAVTISCLNFFLLTSLTETCKLLRHTITNRSFCDRGAGNAREHGGTVFISRHWAKQTRRNVVVTVNTVQLSMLSAASLSVSLSRSRSNAQPSDDLIHRKDLVFSCDRLWTEVIRRLYQSNLPAS